jgi:outer membrane protein assembly factor BamB
MYGKNPVGDRVVQSGCGLSSTKLIKLWETRFRKVTWPLATVCNNNLFLSDNGNLYCLNIDDRSIKWVFECQDCEGYSPVIDSGRIYIWNFQIPKRENYIVCLDATNGKIIWDYLVDTDFLTNPPIVFKNNVYVCSNKGDLICLEGATGNTLWTYKNEYVIYDLKFSNNNVYLPGIKCLDASTGKVVWDKDKEYVLLSPLAIENDRIYFCSYKEDIVVV